MILLGFVSDTSIRTTGPQPLEFHCSAMATLYLCRIAMIRGGMVLEVRTTSFAMRQMERLGGHWNDPEAILTISGFVRSPLITTTTLSWRVVTMKLVIAVTKRDRNFTGQRLAQRDQFCGNADDQSRWDVGSPCPSPCLPMTVCTSGHHQNSSSIARMGASSGPCVAWRPQSRRILAGTFISRAQSQRCEATMTSSSKKLMPAGISFGQLNSTDRKTRMTR